MIECSECRHPRGNPHTPGCRRANRSAIAQHNLGRLAQALRDVALTPGQKRSLRWLAGWEAETVENIASAIESARALERQRKA